MSTMLDSASGLQELRCGGCDRLDRIDISQKSLLHLEVSACPSLRRSAPPPAPPNKVELTLKNTRCVFIRDMWQFVQTSDKCWNNIWSGPYWIHISTTYWQEGVKIKLCDDGDLIYMVCIEYRSFIRAQISLIFILHLEISSNTSSFSMYKKLTVNSERPHFPYTSQYSKPGEGCRPWCNQPIDSTLKRSEVPEVLLILHSTMGRLYAYSRVLKVLEACGCKNLTEVHLFSSLLRRMLFSNCPLLKTLVKILKRHPMLYMNKYKQICRDAKVCE